MIDQKQIIEAIGEALTLPAPDIDPESHLQDDLGLNPVEVADLLEYLARRFNIVFEPAEAQQIKTVSDLIELIEDKSLE
ncbi:MAG: Acyl carrier protein [Candidatus Daviesbacteria bacterium GW2011_GWA1_41_61]|uniref:Acyl carrier protein n=1 Tax=Candidatus Daviesbacteria bacterium GW2011_GWA2_40_9 TaxID=1618424 RepID=A0A0G0U988_9BACT|nr:MAG: ACP-like protein [Candidatus Daviesbacteria bacterium GW2011_GWC1_40_9]KKR83836.1 MAG: Acyl carrier protein [Candidatus Daviesbacteria bacterium GW2011_GWA2_40_9]KKR93445.1 MAG: Acyl carrier protein [Candidatus Daviesbacteria bacterium GW2011_GWB1_41_15]KKS15006.1 MAG: Acyl carrier protein [Candidatus Daviesbacteria bacterium GW2011_GWA1_41_61]